MPPADEREEDRLIFKPTTNGRFSVKHAYKQLVVGTGSHISQTASSSDGREVWSMVWKKGTIQPRVRLFLWKILHDGLPLAGTLHRRIHSSDPICPVCGGGEESPNHLLFACAFARRCWMLCPLPMRTDQFTGSTKETLIFLASATSEEDWTLIVNIF